MPLFDAFVSPRLLWPEDAPWPRRRAHQLIKRFAACFPELSFELRADVRAANAQALLWGDTKVVVLYGGLSRHRRIRMAGLSVALAHEAGHHLGGPPFLAYYRWLSSEERATDWARDIAFPTLYGGKATLIWNRGVRELATALPEGAWLPG